MDIAAWLSSLGLERYKQAFEDNAVDFAVLPGLTADDLKDLGITAVGHRRKLLQAIAVLAEVSRSHGPKPDSPATSPPHSREAERRQLTVMFVDLVGSTILSTRLDPEEMREVIRAYQNAVAGEVVRFEGHVAKFMGDGVLAYFGWPQAHEDEAERAVRAGVAIADAVAKLTTPAKQALTVRVGIATGQVVVGDLIGEGAAQEEAVVGETPNLAARLQALAEPGSVVIAPSTRLLIGELFALADLGAHPVKGFGKRVRAWRVLGDSPVESRFEALHGQRLTPFVGREHEIGLLLERFERAKDGEGQVVLLSGEPGIGKSRTVRALRERLRGERYLVLSNFCSPFHVNSALHPIIDLIERAAGFERDDPSETKLHKLEVLLARAVDNVEQVAPLIAALLTIPTGERYAPLNLTPEAQKRRTFEALVDQLAGLASKQPVLAVYEDVHWIDPTSRDLLELIIERVQRAPALVIITYRPEFVPPWTGYGHVTSLMLGRLARRQGVSMIQAVARGKVLPAEVQEQIVAKTDGVPLFIEELAKSLLESGILREVSDHFVLTGALPALAIPTTLHDSLLARLDRLGPANETAQLGAVMGREFSYELLAAVSQVPESELRDALDQLTGAGLIFRRGLPPDASYMFKHALIQDAAYARLLRSQRQQLHSRVAQVLKARFPHRAAAEPELLAHHHTEAGEIEQAIDYWLVAGRKALARSAMAEAVGQLTKGLELLEGLPGGPERQRREVGLQLALGQALIAAKGYAAAETGRAYARARELCYELGDVSQLFPVLYGRSVFHEHGGEMAAAHEVGRELLGLAEDRGDTGARVAGHRMVGSALFGLGRLVESREHFEAGLALCDPLSDQNSAFLYAIDSRVMCLSWLARVLFILGYPEQAVARNGEVAGYVRELTHPNTAAVALTWGCMFRQLIRERHNAHEQAEAVMALATEQGFPLYLAAGTVVHGWALAANGQAEVGVAEIRRGLADSREGAENWSSYFLGLLADALGRAGQAAAGLSVAVDAIDRAGRAGGRWLEAELHRLRGELLLLLPEPEQPAAEACFRRALALAREQSAKMWELRAATSLACLWQREGRSDEASALLTPIYSWFTEGFDSADLKDANALRDQLGSRGSD